MDKTEQESQQTMTKDEQDVLQTMVKEQEASKTGEDNKQVPKWRGGIKMVINCSIEKAWNLSGDFCGLHRWVSTTEKCVCVEGEQQKSGCVRYMEGSSFPRADGGKSWAREKLLTMDEENRSLSYSMLENNFGLTGYIAKYKMQELVDGAVLVDWSFEVNPIPGSAEQKTADYFSGVFKDVLKKLEALVNSQTTLETSHVTSDSSKFGDANSKSAEFSAVSIG